MHVHYYSHVAGLSAGVILYPFLLYISNFYLTQLVTRVTLIWRQW